MSPGGQYQTGQPVFVYILCPYQKDFYNTIPNQHPKTSLNFSINFSLLCCKYLVTIKEIFCYGD